MQVNIIKDGKNSAMYVYCWWEIKKISGIFYVYRVNQVEQIWAWVHGAYWGVLVKDHWPGHCMGFNMNTAFACFYRCFLNFNWCAVGELWGIGLWVCVTVAQHSVLCLLNFIQYFLQRTKRCPVKSAVCFFLHPYLKVYIFSVFMPTSMNSWEESFGAKFCVD